MCPFYSYQTYLILLRHSDSISPQSVVYPQHVVNVLSFILAEGLAVTEVVSILSKAFQVIAL